MYLKRDDLVKGGVYAIRSRNLLVGVYDGERGFVGIREKFGSQYLFTEYLSRDCGGMIGMDTVWPETLLGTLPEGIEILEHTLKCRTCDKPARNVDGVPYPGNTVCEGGCDDDKRDTAWFTYRPLFDFLQPYHTDQEKRFAAPEQGTGGAE